MMLDGQGFGVKSDTVCCVLEFLHTWNIDGPCCIQSWNALDQGNLCTHQLPPTYFFFAGSTSVLCTGKPRALLGTGGTLGASSVWYCFGQGGTQKIGFAPGALLLVLTSLSVDCPTFSLGWPSFGLHFVGASFEEAPDAPLVPQRGSGKLEGADLPQAFHIHRLKVRHSSLPTSFGNLLASFLR